MTYVENLHRIEPREAVSSLVFPGYGVTAKPGGWAAEVVLPSGARIIASRFDNEREWIADGMYSPTQESFPLYFNGEGSRCTLLREVPLEGQEALNEAVA